ncbi:hypothetical protein SNEBB_001787 [Seison nebaliae]|nr:hypothetical protein SNEBB_001787 [Seison nebaliae]
MTSSLTSMHSCHIDSNKISFITDNHPFKMDYETQQQTNYEASNNNWSDASYGQQQNFQQFEGNNSSGNFVFDPNPILARKQATEEIVYKQPVYIRYLQPPTPEPDEPIIVRQVREKRQDALPPIIIRQRPKTPPTPPPIIYRQKLPKPPPQEAYQVVTRLTTMTADQEKSGSQEIQDNSGISASINGPKVIKGGEFSLNGSEQNVQELVNRGISGPFGNQQIDQKSLREVVDKYGRIPDMLRVTYFVWPEGQEPPGGFSPLSNNLVTGNRENGI